MSIPFYSNIDLSKNQLLNAVLHNLPSAPSSPKEGQFYYNSNDKILYYYNGAKWISGEEYKLPVADASNLGGVKVGSGLNITTAGLLSVALTSELTSVDTNKALTASGGKALKDLIDSINSILSSYGNVVSRDAGLLAGNVPILDSEGKLSSAVIPSIALTDVHESASESEMLALDAQQGDICVRTDINSIYILSRTPASELSNWIAIEIPLTVTSVNGKTGAITLTGSNIDGTVTIDETSETGTINELLQKLSDYIRDNATNETKVTNIAKNVDKENNFIKNIGDNSAKSITVNHNLNSKDIIIELYEIATGQTVYTDVTRVDENNIVLEFAEAPTTNQFRVLIRKIEIK